MYTQDDSHMRLMQQKTQTHMFGDNNRAINHENQGNGSSFSFNDFDGEDGADSHLEWFEHQAGEAIADLLEQKERSIQRLKAIESEIYEIEGQISSVKTTINLFRKRSGVEPLSERQSVDPELNSLYAGKGLRDALVIFAQNNNGMINESVAIETLMKAGFYPTYKKAKASINTTLNRESSPDQENPIFRKLDKGLYKLLESP
jgi:hypothetical protein